MERVNTILLVVIIGVACVSLFRIFKIDSYEKLAREKLEEAELKLEAALASNQAARDSVTSIKMTLAAFKTQNELLKVEMDSIILTDRLSRPKDWEERQAILKNLEDNKNKLIILRDKNAAFE